MLKPSELRFEHHQQWWGSEETAWRAAYGDESCVAWGEGKALKARKPKGVPACNRVGSHEAE